MPKYLIDANLPFRVKIWHSTEFIHQVNLGDNWSDEKIWDYATDSNLTIVTKDSDFSNKIIFQSPPPRVIHIKIGNIKFGEFEKFILANWGKIVSINETHKLTNVFIDRIEGIE
jgi:predicted nuclease of predicted toxin-antitoxin system